MSFHTMNAWQDYATLQRINIRNSYAKLWFSEDHAKNLVDGDIAVPKTDKNEEKNEKRNALRNRAKIWRSRVIPYALDSTLGKWTVYL